MLCMSFRHDTNAYWISKTWPDTPFLVLNSCSAPQITPETDQFVLDPWQKLNFLLASVWSLSISMITIFGAGPFRNSIFENFSRVASVVQLPKLLQIPTALGHCTPGYRCFLARTAACELSTIGTMEGSVPHPYLDALLETWSGIQ